MPYNETGNVLKKPKDELEQTIERNTPEPAFDLATKNDSIMPQIDCNERLNISHLKRLHQ